jgi:4-amino-4-deoxy-L-arabinose transferase-like glycosyltransferase
VRSKQLLSAFSEISLEKYEASFATANAPEFSMSRRSRKQATSAKSAATAELVAKVPAPQKPGKIARALEPLVKRWRPLYSYVVLAALTCAYLLPFSGRAFHIDDTLFLRAGQHIVEKPFDPYGFRINWDQIELPMWQITRNPPLTCYYVALIGRLFGWSERALHLSFVVWALISVLATYFLAERLTKLSLLAASIALLCPAFVVSANSVMCDTMMLAFWVLAVIFWIAGLEPVKPHWLLASGVLIGAATLTKYFGAALIPLLLAYSFRKQRRWSAALLFLVVPVAMIIGYQLWTKSLYGQGLLLDAARFASEHREKGRAPIFGSGLVAVAFLGGCALPALLLAIFLWSRMHTLVVAAISAVAALAVILGWVDSSATIVGSDMIRQAIESHWVLLSVQFALCFAAGASILAAAVSDYWRSKSAESLLLGLWVLGTYLFAGFLNRTVNARSILPLVPAVGILLARRFEERPGFTPLTILTKAAVPLLTAAGLVFWVTIGDTQLANSARTAANALHENLRDRPVFFEGHWGFQYYMEAFGARPVDVTNFQFQNGDIFVVAENNAGVIALRPEFVAGGQGTEIEIDGPTGVTTASWKMGAGFYSSHWGPLPFTIGTIPPEHYWIYALVNPPAKTSESGNLRVPAP